MSAMNTAPHLLPRAIGDLLGKLPAYPGSLLFVAALNLALSRQLAADVTGMLEGRKLRLRVTDANWTFDFAWARDGFVATRNTGDADITISASAGDFVRLARREEETRLLAAYFGQAADQATLRSFAAMKCAALMREERSLIERHGLDGWRVSLGAAEGELAPPATVTLSVPCATARVSV